MKKLISILFILLSLNVNAQEQTILNEIQLDDANTYVLHRALETKLKDTIRLKGCYFMDVYANVCVYVNEGKVYKVTIKQIGETMGERNGKYEDEYRLVYKLKNKYEPNIFHHDKKYYYHFDQTFFGQSLRTYIYEIDGGWCIIEDYVGFIRSKDKSRYEITYVDKTEGKKLYDKGIKVVNFKYNDQIFGEKKEKKEKKGVIRF